MNCLQLCLQFVLTLSLGIEIWGAKAISHYLDEDADYEWRTNDVDGNMEKYPNVTSDCHLETTPGKLNAYWLYTRRHGNESEIIQHGHETSLRLSSYDPKKPLNVITHGWHAFGHTKGCERIRKAFLRSRDCNVIILDWSIVAGARYFCAAHSMPDIAKHLALFIKWLFKQAGGSLSQLHMVGFGLGAHLVGRAGDELRVRLDQVPNRITGLDPTGNMFFCGPGIERPNARYVEIIHTDDLGAGLNKVVGHVDFFPNGGRYQPGCKGKKSCSHMRAYDLFAASITSKPILLGKLCNDVVEATHRTCNGKSLRLGTDDMNKNGAGHFSLNTTSKWPFDIKNTKT